MKCRNAMIYADMGIMGWVWLLVPLRVFGYHGNCEEKVRVVKELGHWVRVTQ